MLTTLKKNFIILVPHPQRPFDPRLFTRRTQTTSPGRRPLAHRRTLRPISRKRPSSVSQHTRHRRRSLHQGGPRLLPIKSMPSGNGMSMFQLVASVAGGSTSSPEE